MQQLEERVAGRIGEWLARRMSWLVPRVRSVYVYVAQLLALCAWLLALPHAVDVDDDGALAHSDPDRVLPAGLELLVDDALVVSDGGLAIDDVQPAARTNTRSTQTWQRVRRMARTHRCPG